MPRRGEGSCLRRQVQLPGKECPRAVRGSAFVIWPGRSFARAAEGSTRSVGPVFRPNGVNLRPVARPLTPLGAWSSARHFFDSDVSRNCRAQAPSSLSPYRGRGATKPRTSFYARCLPRSVAPRPCTGERDVRHLRLAIPQPDQVSKRPAEDQVPDRVRGRASSAKYSFPEDSVQELVLVVVCESGDLLGLLLPKAAQDL